MSYANYTDADAAFDAEQLGTGPFAGPDPFKAKIREWGRQWALNNPDWALHLVDLSSTFDQCYWAENQACNDAKAIFRLYSAEDHDEFLEGAREQAGEAQQ